MPRVLILGATGYLGLPLCDALVRSGAHTVFGLARTQAKADQLSAREVIPILCPGLSAVDVWGAALARHAIDTVVDLSGAVAENKLIIDTLLAEAERRETALLQKDGNGVAAPHPKLAYLYLSGDWVQGAPPRLVSDLTPPGTALAPAEPAPLTAWRVPLEQRILSAEVRRRLDVAVVRPCLIYGRSSYLFDVLFAPLLQAKGEGATTKKVQVPAAKDARINLVHVDDVADAVERVVARMPGLLGEWPVFDVATERVEMPALLRAVADGLGVDRGVEIECVGTGGDPFLEAMSLSSWEESERAKLVLGWNPKRVSFVNRSEIFARAWEVSRAKSG